MTMSHPFYYATFTKQTNFVDGYGLKKVVWLSSTARP